jgi:N-acyl-D-aspartate/D-glutamate deacylase
VHDLVIRGGRVVDGTGSPARTADIAVDGDRITAVGRVTGPARRTIDADGFLVTPGFVDLHTHYDGQATWDPDMTPSSGHGITTVVMGNCGVGFAPVAPDRHDWLIGLMEGVEDIPGAALADGIDWAWETFPQYLDALARLPRVLDVAALVPDGAVRAYVMGERGARNEPATAEDVAAMAAIVREGVAAGALGLSMNRTSVHRAIDGEPVPGTFATVDEVVGLCDVLGELGAGLVELAPAGVVGEDLDAPARELAWMRDVAARTGRPVTFVLVQHFADPDAWRVTLAGAAEARAAGIPLVPQTHFRAPSVLAGLDTKANPFARCPTWVGELAPLPRAERLRRLTGDAPTRDRLVTEAEARAADILVGWVRFDRLWALGDPPDYEQPASRSVAAVAAAEGRSPFAVALEWMLRRDGTELLMAPVGNYAEASYDPVHTMLSDPTTVIGLSDGGAHCASICDASMPTYLLTHWVRDRTRSARLPLELAVAKMSGETAALAGLDDRGLLVPGRKADLNVIDHDGLRLLPPRLVHDLPTGAGRLVQDAIGYRATVCSGAVTFEDDRPTGERPGVLVRGARP